jgi:hypothetical protein
VERGWNGAGIEGENEPPPPPRGMNETKRRWGENETTKEGENGDREGGGRRNGARRQGAGRANYTTTNRGEPGEEEEEGGNQTTTTRGRNQTTTTSTTHLQPHEQLLVGWTVGGTPTLEAPTTRGGETATTRRGQGGETTADAAYEASPTTAMSHARGVERSATEYVRAKGGARGGHVTPSVDDENPSRTRGVFFPYSSYIIVIISSNIH